MVGGFLSILVVALLEQPGIRGAGYVERHVERSPSLDLSFSFLLLSSGSRNLNRPE